MKVKFSFTFGFAATPPPYVRLSVDKNPNPALFDLFPIPMNQKETSLVWEGEFTYEGNSLSGYGYWMQYGGAIGAPWKLAIYKGDEKNPFILLNDLVRKEDIPGFIHGVFK